MNKEKDTAYQSIVNDLSNAMATIDSNRLSVRINNIESMKNRIKEYKLANRDNLRKGIYNPLFILCGGKKNYHMYNDNSITSIIEIITKDHNEKIEARNERIAQKLLPLRIISVSGAIGKSDTSFEGQYIAQTDKGEKRIAVRIIFAGGYNIQCYHCRALVSIK